MLAVQAQTEQLNVAGAVQVVEAILDGKTHWPPQATLPVATQFKVVPSFATAGQVAALTACVITMPQQIKVAAIMALFLKNILLIFYLQQAKYKDSIQSMVYPTLFKPSRDQKVPFVVVALIFQPPQSLEMAPGPELTQT